MAAIYKKSSKQQMIALKDVKKKRNTGAHC
jgi:hypothetical protein